MHFRVSGEPAVSLGCCYVPLSCSLDVMGCTWMFVCSLWNCVMLLSGSLVLMGGGLVFVGTGIMLVSLMSDNFVLLRGTLHLVRSSQVMVLGSGAFLLSKRWLVGGMRVGGCSGCSCGRGGLGRRVVAMCGRHVNGRMCFCARRMNLAVLGGLFGAGRCC